MPKASPAPYLFHGETTSLCETCLQLVPAKILIEGDDVFYKKRCAEHGVQKTRVSSDATWFRSTRDWLKPGDRPLLRQTETVRGCPWDCGLCPDHEQHSCLAIVEVNDACNLACPVCFAESSPARDGSRSLAEVEQMLDALVASEGEPDLVQISGGEPTIHPDIIEILRAAKARPIRHVMLNTNGVRIADDPAFVRELAALGPGFEVYLQFDSLAPQGLIHMRGADLTGVRKRALDNLEAAGVSTSLVATVKRGVNDHEIGDILRHAHGYSCVRGVTFQPVQDAGRNRGFAKDDRVLLTDIRSAIVAQSDLFGADDIIPLPCNPESIAIGFGLRTKAGVTPVTRLLPKEELLNAPSTIAFEARPELKKKLFDLLSLSTTEASMAGRLGALLCCLPGFELPDGLGYKNVFRVTIIQFMDRYNFCLGGVKRSCIHFVTPEGRIIPFDTYNLFYREGRGFPGEVT